MIRASKKKGMAMSVKNDMKQNEFDFKSIAKIENLLVKYKEAYIKRYGNSEGLNKFEKTFLKNGFSSVEETAKEVYINMRWNVKHGAMGKNIAADFFGNGSVSDAAQKAMNESMIVALRLDSNNPNVSAFVKQVVSAYKEDGIHQKELASGKRKAGDISREKQIEYVKENIDVLYSMSDRLKAVAAKVSKIAKEEGFIKVFPAVMAGGIKVLGGESSLMKFEDAMDSNKRRLDALGDSMKEIVVSVAKIISAPFSIAVAKERAKEMREKAFQNDAAFGMGGKAPKYGMGREAA